MDEIERLGRNVKRLRKATGISQEAFADKIEMNRTYLSDIERGARNPTVRIVAKLAAALNVTAGQLLDDEIK